MHKTNKPHIKISPVHDNPGHYGHAVEISLPDPFSISLSPPVQEIVATLERMSCTQIGS